MINEIKKKLEAGEQAQLECIDENGFIEYSKMTTCGAVNDVIFDDVLSSSLIVSGLLKVGNSYGLYIDNDSHLLWDGELEFFRIQSQLEEVDA